MQSAVDIVHTSPHPTNKIAATLAGNGFSLSRVNSWPAPIADKIGAETRIGNSSGTIHAETACLLGAANATEGTAVFITDPPCPNCAKSMAEAGIKELYIDHKGFDKEWAARRGGHFDHMSMQIFQRAGIRVHEIRRKEQTIRAINQIENGYTPPEENPLTVTEMQFVEEKAFLQSIKNAKYKTPFAITIARCGGKIFTLEATPHLVTGYTTETLNEKPEDKYSFVMEPVNRLIMGAARRGLKIENGFLYSSRVPTSRELVNMVGACLTKIRIGNRDESRDEHGKTALKQLSDAGILTLD